MFHQILSALACAVYAREQAACTRGYCTGKMHAGNSADAREALAWHAVRITLLTQFSDYSHADV